MTTFYDCLDNTASKIMETDNFGVTASYTVKATGIGTFVSAIIHQPHAVPFQDLSERKIENDGYMWTVHVRKDAKVIFSKQGQSSNFALINLLVSEVPAVVPGDTITISGTWEVV